MLLFAIWVALGALVGLLVGIHRCSDVSRNLPLSGHDLYIGFCAGMGAILGFLVFATLTMFYYGPLTR